MAASMPHMGGAGPMTPQQNQQNQQNQIRQTLAHMVYQNILQNTPAALTGWQSTVPTQDRAARAQNLYEHRSSPPSLLSYIPPVLNVCVVLDC